MFDGQTPSSEKSLPRYKQVYNLYNVVVTPEESQVYTYRSDIPARAFVSPKDYLFPIPDDSYKKTPSLGQNSGWELSDAKKDETTEGGETSGEGESTGE